MRVNQKFDQPIELEFDLKELGTRKLIRSLFKQLKHLCTKP